MIGKVLTIAGSDSCGGAGIQADIKTITMHGCYAMSVITALTAQNTTGVTAISEVSPEFVAAQIDAVFTDIFPDAVKIGMVSDISIIHVIAEKLKQYHPAHIVADPVMISTSGHKLIHEDAIAALIAELLPLAEIITPNIPETEALTGMQVATVADMKKAAEHLAQKFGTAVLVKGGHLHEKSVDVLYQNQESVIFDAERINTNNTHGTGCTLSSAIASHLAKGQSLTESVRCAKNYLTGALKTGFDIGKGCGSLLHNYQIITESC